VLLFLLKLYESSTSKKCTSGTTLKTVDAQLISVKPTPAHQELEVKIRSTNLLSNEIDIIIAEKLQKIVNPYVERALDKSTVKNLNQT
jgi:hypothetical protein